MTYLNGSKMVCESLKNRRVTLASSHAVVLLVSAALTTGIALQASQPSGPSLQARVVAASPSVRFEPKGTQVIALSPDGSRLVYVANSGGGTQLYLRSMNSSKATPIPGTEGAETPFFSPDGKSVGFFADAKVKKISLSGGVPVTICNAPVSGRGASWGPDNTIVFTPSSTLGLFRVSADGGTPKLLTTPDRKDHETSNRWPDVLPGGKAALFTKWGGALRKQVGVVMLDTGEQRVLLEGTSYARYVSPGYLVYAEAGELLAVPFDLKRLEVTGPPVSILKGVAMNPISGVAGFTISADGSTLVQVAGGTNFGDHRTLVWVDRKGMAQPLPTPPRAYVSPRLSPDGKRLAVGIQGDDAVWINELGQDSLTKLSKSAGIPFPIWAPDGQYVAFGFSAPPNLHKMLVDGSATAERLSTSEYSQWAGSWSPDGKVIAYSEADPKTGFDIWTVKLDGDRKPQVFLQTPFNEVGASFSPDGHWLAYHSDESGQPEIYVQPYPGPGERTRISIDGGTEPVWARNGRELFYRNGDKLMTVAVETKSRFTAAKPKLLFEGHYAYTSSYLQYYDVSPDGQRFLMIKAGDEEMPSAKVTVVRKLSEELGHLAPAKN